MTYTEIFDDVVEIMKHDSATCKDIPGGDPAPFRERITADMTDEPFAALVSDYLLTFQLTGHLYFFRESTETSNAYPPVSVQRYENALYVTGAAADAELRHGDRILAIDGVSIDETAERKAPFFSGEAPERQGRSWELLLLRAETVTVLPKGGKTPETLPFHPSSTGGIHNGALAVRPLSDDTLLMTLPHFLKRHCVEDLIKQYRSAFRNCRYLVIDVRGNGGGNSMEYKCLFSYCFPKGKHSYSIYARSDDEINYTERNCDLKQKLLIEYGLNKRYTQRFVKNRGRGFVAEVSDNGGNVSIKGRALPEKVLILTDENCGSAGDSFVEELSCSPKVTVLGRPTAGINDYTDVCYQAYGEFRFMYPMKRSLLIDQGKGQAHKGVPVDIHIPWTPEHLERDVELDTALRLIEEDRKSKN